MFLSFLYFSFVNLYWIKSLIFRANDESVFPPTDKLESVTSIVLPNILLTNPNERN